MTRHPDNDPPGPSARLSRRARLHGLAFAGAALATTLLTLGAAGIPSSRPTRAGDPKRSSGNPFGACLDRSSEARTCHARVQLGMMLALRGLPSARCTTPFVHDGCARQQVR